MKMVSVIIPIYNVEQYLRQCIDSVLAQSYRDIEIILVDDGSPDSCPEICDDYALKYKNIRVIHQKNKGLSGARNAGIDKAKGNFIFFLDSDDYISPQCIELLVDESENGMFAMTGYKLDVAGSGVQDAVQAYGRYLSLKDYLFDFHRLFATKFNFAWGKLYDADVIKANDLKFIEGQALTEDVMFNLEYYPHCNNGIVAVDHDGYYYRQSDSNTLSKRFDKRMFLWNETAYTAIREFLLSREALTIENKNSLMNNIFGNYMYSFRLIALNSDLTKKEKKHLIKQYCNTPIFVDSIEQGTDGRRIDSRLFSWLINKGHIALFISLEVLKNRLRRN